MMKNLMLITGILILMLGCSWLSGGKIPNEQISKDLDSKIMKPSKGLVNWTFKEDATRCFQITESKFEGDSGKLTLKLAATQLLSDDVMVLYGSVDVKYTKVGDKWTLDSIESKDVEGKTVSMDDAMTKFSVVARPICANYSDMPQSRK